MTTHIYEYVLETKDFFYFATKEIAQNATFTNNVIHNYALMYALHDKTRITSPLNKKNKQEPAYQELFTGKYGMKAKYYVSPARLIHETPTQTHFFNSVGEEIYYSIELDKPKNLNFPRIGSYQKLTPQARYAGIIMSSQELAKTFIIRLGKKRSPCRISLTELKGKTIRVPKTNPVQIKNAINPQDIMSNGPLDTPDNNSVQIHKADLLMIPPTPILTEIHASGTLFNSKDEYYILPTKYQ